MPVYEVTQTLQLHHNNKCGPVSLQAEETELVRGLFDLRQLRETIQQKNFMLPLSRSFMLWWKTCYSSVPVFHSSVSSVPVEM